MKFFRSNELSRFLSFDETFKIACAIREIHKYLKKTELCITNIQLVTNSH